MQDKVTQQRNMNKIKKLAIVYTKLLTTLNLETLDYINSC